MKEIAIRVFENKKYGTTYGPGLRRHAVFNATAEINEPYAKYLLDFEAGPYWLARAKSDDQLAFAREFTGEAETYDDILWSWVKWYDKSTGDKEYVNGFAAYDLSTEEVIFDLRDTRRELVEKWVLPIRPCQERNGKNSPAFLAVNYDLMH